MKVLHLRASNFYGGPERQLHQHALLAKGSEVLVVVGSFSESGRTPEFLTVIADDGVETALFPVRNAYDRTAIRLIREYLHDSKVDILCTHDYRTHVLGWLAKRSSGVKWIAFSRGWTRENLKVRIYHILDRIIIRLADHVVAVSEAQKRRLAKLHIADRKISVVHNAVEPKQFEGTEAVDLRAKYGFAPDTTIGVAAGRFSREKGQAILGWAAAMALKRTPGLRFVLFGDGPDAPRVQRMIAKLGISEKVLCPGFERNLIGHLKGADFLINPSLSEGLPNVVLEAIALELPVLATNVGGVPELITHDRSGYLVPPDDVQALAEGMLFMSAHSNRAKAFAENARQRLETDFTFIRQFDKLKRVYQKVLSG
ncbi:MAG TPA: glycosyltransferase family 4 protein [Candidatus Deferrimicrobium sp.]|nr:glycosyltransferase family 4 protein [Candidatus Deferrimicrobium sp.]